MRWPRMRSTESEQSLAHGPHALVVERAVCNEQLKIYEVMCAVTAGRADRVQLLSDLVVVGDHWHGRGFGESEGSEQRRNVSGHCGGRVDGVAQLVVANLQQQSQQVLTEVPNFEIAGRHDVV